MSQVWARRTTRLDIGTGCDRILLVWQLLTLIKLCMKVAVLLEGLLASFGDHWECSIKGDSAAHSHSHVSPTFGMSMVLVRNASTNRNGAKVNSINLPAKPNLSAYRDFPFLHEAH